MGMFRNLVAVISAAVLVATSLAAHSQDLEKRAYTYSPWAKGLFSEVVTVKQPRRFIFLAGVGAEDATATEPGKILYLGDFMGQCLYAWEKIKQTLVKQGATINDIVKITTYVTDVRYLPEFRKCDAHAEGNAEHADTLVEVNHLARPGMLIEIDVIATTAK